MPRFKASWARLSDDSWGVRVDDTTPARGAGKLAGQEIVVTKRSGEQQDVKLDKLVQAWNAGASAHYTVARRRKNGQPPPQKPRGKVVVRAEHLRELMEKRQVTIDGVTIVWEVDG